MGILASIVGLFAGLALAKGLFSLFDAVGFTLAEQRPDARDANVVVALLVGIAVTLLASLRPALRATRVPPIAAVREGATLPESRFARYRLPAAALLTALGFAGLLAGLFVPDLGTGQILLYMLGGALLVFIGVALLSVRLVGPFAWTLGWPATKIGGAAGRARARQRAAQSPADRLDRFGPDDRARARHACVHARGRHRLELPRRREGHLEERRLRDHRAEQLHPDPDRRVGSGREDAGRHCGRERARR